MSLSPTPILITTDGHVWSWNELVGEYHPAIEALARSRGIGDAADVAQEVFADAMKRLEGFQGGRRELRSFLFTIAHRRVADRHRRFYRRPELLTGLVGDGPSSEPEPDDQIIERSDSIDAFAALAQLDERTRRVLLLRIVDELETEEVAELLAISAVNVRAIQSRGLKKIRKILENSRHKTHPRAMALVVIPVFNRLRHSESLPTDGLVAEWITALRAEAAAAGANSTAEVMALVAEGAAGSGLAIGALVSATSTSTVAATAVTTGGTAMNTLTVAILAAGSAALGTGAVVTTASSDSSSRADQNTQVNATSQFDDRRLVVDGRSTSSLEGARNDDSTLDANGSTELDAIISFDEPGERDLAAEAMLSLRTNLGLTSFDDDAGNETSLVSATGTDLVLSFDDDDTTSNVQVASDVEVSSSLSGESSLTGDGIDSSLTTGADATLTLAAGGDESGSVDAQVESGVILATQTADAEDSASVGAQLSTNGSVESDANDDEASLGVDVGLDADANIIVGGGLSLGLGG